MRTTLVEALLLLLIGAALGAAGMAIAYEYLGC